MRRFSPRAELIAIGLGFVVVSLSVWSVGRWLDLPLLSFSGLMLLASTFVPMPADAYVVHTAGSFDPLVVASVGGVVNAFGVLGERRFLIRLSEFSVGERLKEFIGTNRYLGLLDKHMFLGLVTAAASPIPFEVFRVIAVARNVNVVTYFFATLVGRGARFYVLALAGGWFAAKGILQLVVVVLIAIFLISLFRSGLRVRGDRNPEGGTDADGV